MTELTLQVENNIREHQLFASGQFLLLAVSGGLDSMVLLHIVGRLADRHGWLPVVLHFNHQLRAESDADEEFVRGTVAGLGMKFVSEKGDVKSYSRERKLSLEMGGRSLRHEFFVRTAVALGIGTVALGHHADDQVELFFLRALRGAGGEGLSGMEWSGPSSKNPQVRLVRPFLNVTKQELHAYAAREKLEFREDATNGQLDSDRNRLRNELLPMIRDRYQPGLVRTTLRLMEIVGGEADFAMATAKRWLSNRSEFGFDQLHRAVQRQVLRLGLIELGIQPEFDLVERLRSSPDEVVMVRPELTVWRDHHGNLRSRPVAAAVFREEQRRVGLSAGRGSMEFAEVTIDWELVDWQRAGGLESKLSGAPKNSEYFDGQKIGSEICLRHWRPGDRFQPIGMKHAVKLQDLLTNQKISREQKRRLVVGTNVQGEIFWVEGLRISESFKVSEKTVSALRWNWSRAGNGMD